MTYYDTSYPPSLWNSPPSDVSGISPATKAVGAAAFIITVNGSGFTDESVVSFEGDPRDTTFVSETELTAHIGGIVAPARTAQVTVSTGGTFPFIITSVVQQEPSATVTARTVAPDGPQVPQDSPGDPGGTDGPQDSPEAPEAS